MSEAATRQAAPDPAHIVEARRLLRTGLTASLATIGADGAPFVSFVAYATRMDGSPLFMFSGLSAHTKNLAREPRFALLIADAPKAAGDPMDGARVTLGGRMARSDDPADRARYLRRHPKAELYAALPDFAVHVGRLEDVHYVGGFARARNLAVRDVLLDAEGAAALAAAEDDIVAHMNHDHAEAVSLYATRLLGQGEGVWRMTGLDPEGADLRAENRTARLLFGRRVAGPADAREALVALAKRARAG